MHNDVKQCFRDSNVHCGSCSQERPLYGVVFPEAGNLSGSNADMCSVAGPSSNGSGNFFVLLVRSNKTDPESLLLFPLLQALLAAILDLSVTTTDNSHTAFRGVLRHCT